MMLGDIVRIGASLWVVADSDVPGAELTPSLRVVQPGEGGIYRGAVVPRESCVFVGTPVLCSGDRVSFWGKPFEIVSWPLRSHTIRVRQKHQRSIGNGGQHTWTGESEASAPLLIDENLKRLLKEIIE